MLVHVISPMKSYYVHHFNIATQMWCLGRFPPLIIGDLVDENNPYWNNYLSHLEIMDEVFAPVYCLNRKDQLSENDYRGLFHVQKL